MEDEYVGRPLYELNRKEVDRILRCSTGSTFRLVDTVGRL